MTQKIERQPPVGLWAYYAGRFYAVSLFDESRQLDHVTWFPSLGLPDYGPEFDRVLRGRLIWDWHMDQFLLTYYGTRLLPNHVYKQVIDHFEVGDHIVVEKPASSHWQ